MLCSHQLTDYLSLYGSKEGVEHERPLLDDDKDDDARLRRKVHKKVRDVPVASRPTDTDIRKKSLWGANHRRQAKTNNTHLS